MHLNCLYYSCTRKRQANLSPWKIKLKIVFAILWKITNVIKSTDFTSNFSLTVCTTSLLVRLRLIHPTPGIEPGGPMRGAISSISSMSATLDTFHADKSQNLACSYFRELCQQTIGWIFSSGTREAYASRHNDGLVDGAPLNPLITILL